MPATTFTSTIQLPDIKARVEAERKLSKLVGKMVAVEFPGGAIVIGKLSRIHGGVMTVKREQASTKYIALEEALRVRVE